ncbi:MAG: hypothetical protein P1P88_15955 [Bacteroidales bacterium]|nr:hypothetical protein [Bacteroidales bacterium]
MKRKLKIIINTILLIGLLGCDPVHPIRLENLTGEKIQVLYNYDGEINFFKPYDFKLVERNGIKYNSIILDSLDYVYIGEIVARFSPKPDDITIDRLEIWMENDTLKFIGKRAIFSMVNKQSRLDWRITIK